MPQMPVQGRGLDGIRKKRNRETKCYQGYTKALFGTYLTDSDLGIFKKKSTLRGNKTNSIIVSIKKLINAFLMPAMADKALLQTN